MKRVAMGLLGRMTGWNQTQDAHNAVLANYLAETASREMKSEIANRLILIQQQARREGVTDPRSILADLSGQPRIVQMNFIALACNGLGIPPGLRGLSFANVDNPYLADDQSSLNRIDVAMIDLSRRSGKALSWPGNNVKINFLLWMRLPERGRTDQTSGPRTTPASNTNSQPFFGKKIWSNDAQVANRESASDAEVKGYPRSEAFHGSQDQENLRGALADNTMKFNELFNNFLTLRPVSVIHRLDADFDFFLDRWRQHLATGHALESAQDEDEVNFGMTVYTKTMGSLMTAIEILDRRSQKTGFNLECDLLKCAEILIQDATLRARILNVEIDGINC
ncbi:hypothetical protein EAH79_14825 [Sphingomonas koreensis]|nr:hypothetical protein EAH79_14825 [Sphingomonas koreensis]